jgi:Protein of unknown function (DUF3604)
MRIIRRLVVALLALIILAGVYVGGAWMHLYGRHLGAGTPSGKTIPAPVVAARSAARVDAGRQLGVGEGKQILFGDLHVHSTFSTDAFLWSLPMVQGEGAHPISDACDYARYCSALDFWSITDHAEASTPQRWRETKKAIRECNAMSGDADNPDVAVFLGFEWSQVGATPAEHYGHKNVIFRGLDDDQVSARPIGASGIATDGLRSSVGQMSPLTALLDFPNRQRYFDFVQFMDEVRAVPSCAKGVDTRKLPPDCYESAATPAELFEKLDQWNVDALVIPHGNTWGFYSPPGTTWDKQLVGAMHDPDRQFLIEIMSGHGNSEQYRDWRAVRTDDKGMLYCPAPTADYLPSCWRAGEIIYERCMKAGREKKIDLPSVSESYGADVLAMECGRRAAEARQNYAEVGIIGSWAIPGVTPEDWLDSGQCRDCFIPSFNYRPGGSTQYALAISNFDDPAHPRRFHFGIIASSDNHQARPGTGYKEFDRLETTEAGGPRDEKWRQRLTAPRGAPEPRSQRVNPDEIRALGFRALEFERQSSFFMTGGLVAIHADGRSRQQVWDALQRKEVYGTSGDRILLWFDLLNPEGGDGAKTVPMGSDAIMHQNPRFSVRAVGAFKQKPGCPDHALSGLSHERLEWLCKGECYNPSDQRKRVTRIEVVRIRPQIKPGEPVRDLIDDPWLTLPCPASAEGCAVQFEDPDYAASGRSAVYYVRAIEEPSPAVNAGNLRCKRDESGNCLEVHPCYGDYRTPKTDDCLATIEERAWSSPIYLDPS